MLEFKASSESLDNYKKATEVLQNQIKHIIVIFLRAFEQKDKIDYKQNNNLLNQLNVILDGANLILGCSKVD